MCRYKVPTYNDQTDGVDSHFGVRAETMVSKSP